MDRSQASGAWHDLLLCSVCLCLETRLGSLHRPVRAAFFRTVGARYRARHFGVADGDFTGNCRRRVAVFVSTAAGAATDWPGRAGVSQPAAARTIFAPRSCVPGSKSFCRRGLGGALGERPYPAVCRYRALRLHAAIRRFVALPPAGMGTHAGVPARHILCHSLAAWRAIGPAFWRAARGPDSVFVSGRASILVFLCLLLVLCHTDRRGPDRPSSKVSIPGGNRFEKNAALSGGRWGGAARSDRRCGGLFLHRRARRGRGDPVQAFAANPRPAGRNVVDDL